VTLVPAKGCFAGKIHKPESFSTAILYLLTLYTFSAMHKLGSDEVFHFYLGGPVTMLQLHPNGSSEVITLGQAIFNDQRIQVTPLNRVLNLKIISR